MTIVSLCFGSQNLPCEVGWVSHKYPAYNVSLPLNHDQFLPPGASCHSSPPHEPCHTLLYHAPCGSPCANIVICHLLHLPHVAIYPLLVNPVVPIIMSGLSTLLRLARVTNRDSAGLFGRLPRPLPPNSDIFTRTATRYQNNACCGN